MTGGGNRFVGRVYRAHNPRWSFSPASGAGAAKHGGRFNRPGVAALYTSSRYELAITEAHHGLPFKLQPLTIVGYEVDHADILDLSSTVVRRAAGIHFDELAAPWELMAFEGRQPPGWVLADRLIEQGVGGIIVPSFAAHAPAYGYNIVFWDWRPEPPRQVCVIDDENRLPADGSSWQ